VVDGQQPDRVAERVEQHRRLRVQVDDRVGVRADPVGGQVQGRLAARDGMTGAHDTVEDADQGELVGYQLVERAA
jgi:hypothetical protein